MWFLWLNTQQHNESIHTHLQGVKTKKILIFVNILNRFFLAIKKQIKCILLLLLINNINLFGENESKNSKNCNFTNLSVRWVKYKQSPFCLILNFTMSLRHLIYFLFLLSIGRYNYLPKNRKKTFKPSYLFCSSL